MANDYSGFALVLDSLNVSAKLPFELIPDHCFRKAETQEIERIKKELSAYKLSETLYEFEIIELANEKHEGRRLPPEKWRYYVISFSPTNDKLGDLEYAANLLKNDINIGYAFFNDSSGFPSGIVYNMAQISTFFSDRHGHMEIPKPIDNDELRQITTNYSLVTGLDKTRYPNVSRVVADFHQTKAITSRSTLKVLSYFSIIECLLTHPPFPTDRTDSVTRQITSKMCLLSKRFQRGLQYESFFPNIVEPEKVWNRLYAYRSILAHGGNIDFHQKFSALISTDNIRFFLAETLKLLILYALKEPEFLADLQKC